MVNVGDLKTKISLDSAEFNRSMASVNRELRGLKHEQKAVTSSGTGFARGLNELKDKSNVLNRTLDLQRDKVTELKRRYDESKESTGENSIETEKANIAYQKAKAEMNKTENALKGVTAEIERQTNPLLNLGNTMQDTGKKMQKVGDDMTKFGKSWTMKVTAPILALGGGALKVGMDFEEGMSNVQAISGATGDDLAKMSEQARDMGATTVFSATEAADGMSFLAMAGFETNEIMEAMPGLLDLAASSNMDLARAADITSNIISGFNLQAEESGRVSDVLAKGASTANTNVEQLGNAMEVVAPIGEMVGLEIEGLTAGIGRMSDAGIQGQKAGRQLRQGILRLSDPTGKAADLIEELGINVFDADGNMKDLDAVVGELNKGLEGMDSQAQAAALSTIFGSESTAGWSALLKVGQDDLRDYTKELQDSEGAAEEMADIMNDNAKGALKEMKSALEEAGIAVSEHLIPAFTDLVEWGTDLIRKFGELDKEQQEQILKWAAIAAGVGPASLAFGMASKGIGGLLDIGGRFFSFLGRTGGKGLLGRMGIMGAPTGPVLLATAAVAGLGGIMYAAYKDSKKLHDISTETSDKLLDQADSLEELVAEFDELQGSSKLTNDQFGRMLDIEKELEQTQNPARIAELKDEYEYLREKSGLTNDEIEEMIELNNDIIEQSPTVEQSFTDKGNAVVESTDAVKEYIQSLRDMAFIELQAEQVKALENEATLRQENKEITEDLLKVEDEIQELLQMRDMSLEEIDERVKEINQAFSDGISTTEEQHKLDRERASLLAVKRGTILETLEKMEEERDALIEKKELNDEELAKLEEINVAMAEMLLAEVDINWEKGEGLKKLDETIQKLKDERDEILGNMTEEEKKNGIYDDHLSKLNEMIGDHEYIKDQIQDETGYQSEQNNELDKQNRKIENAGLKYIDNEGNIRKITIAQEGTNEKIGEGISHAFDLNRELNKNINKDINVDDHGSAEKITAEAGKGVTKTVTIKAKSGAINLGVLGSIPAYKDGINSHPGGKALVGEEGYELARHGSNWSMLGFGVTELPRGTEVFTHGESKGILRALNNLPSYATGTSSPGESDRVVGQLNEPITTSNTVNLSRMFEGASFIVREEADIPKIAKLLNDYIKKGARSKGVIM